MKFFKSGKVKCKITIDLPGSLFLSNNLNGVLPDITFLFTYKVLYKSLHVQNFHYFVKHIVLNCPISPINTVAVITILV